MSEIGHARPVDYGPLSDDNWSLRWPQSEFMFARMGREDAQITSVLKAISLPIRRATWRVSSNGAPDEIVGLVAGDLRLPVLGDESQHPVAPLTGRMSWVEHLRWALLSLQFGHMFFEQVYRVGSDGRDHLVKLAPRLPGTVTKINVARDGGLDSIEQAQPVGSGGRFGSDTIRIPVDRLVAYVHDPIDTTWTGTSVLRAAYKHWHVRDELIRLEVSALERNGMGIPVYEGTDLVADKTEAERDIATGMEIVHGLRAGETAGAAIPHGAKLDIKGTQGQLASPRQAIEYHDSMMARCVLAHFLNLSDKGGSYALAETQADLFIQSLQTTAEWVAATANQHIVEDLVRVAFDGYEGPFPMLVFDPIASKKELTAEALATLVQAGIIFTDRPLEEEVRRRFTLPGKPVDKSGGVPSATKNPVSAGKKVSDSVQLTLPGLEPITIKTRA